VSSAEDQESVRAGALIERLLTDPAFRAEFRVDPAKACLGAGLPQLADDLGGSGKAMQTLELRESRSSLAGVVMAVAVEGMAVAEVQRLFGHGLHGNPQHGALNRVLHGGRLPNPAAQLQHAANPNAIQHNLQRAASSPSSGSHAGSGSPAIVPGAGAAGAGSGAAAAGGAAQAGAGGAGAAAGAAGAGGAAGAAPAGGGGAAGLAHAAAAGAGGVSRVLLLLLLQARVAGWVVRLLRLRWV
jgi:hypothetical protein